MSSPKLNNIIILGCILCYASVVLFGLDARFLDMKGYGANCNVRERFFVGYNLQRIVIQLYAGGHQFSQWHFLCGCLEGSCPKSHFKDSLYMQS